jgi:plasmid stabilization system protein ParE
MSSLDSLIDGIMNHDGLSDKKKHILAGFAREANHPELRFHPDFIVRNHRFISRKSAERLFYLDFRHGKEAANRIVEKLPATLGYSLSRTRGIYAFFDERHGKEAANKIVEGLPPILSCSLSRTGEIYAFLDERHGEEAANRIVEKLPTALGYSLSRTKGIYAFLDERHGREAANRIVEKLPSALGYSLSRTKEIYAFLDERHGEEAANRIVETQPTVLSCSISRTKEIYVSLGRKNVDPVGYVEKFPVLLYFSSGFIETHSLEFIFEVLRKMAEKRSYREVSPYVQVGERENYHCLIGKYLERI